MTRLAPHRNVERGRGAPILLRALFAAGLVALIAGVAWVANGGMGLVVASLTSAVSGVVTGIVATPAPTDSPVPVVADAPEIAKPENPYTNGDTIDVTVAVPGRMAGQPDHEVRLWLALDGEPPLVVAQGAVGATATVVLPDVPLVRGKNPFYATIQGPSTESDPSPTVIWVQDLAKPRIDIASPAANQLVNGETVTLTGKRLARKR